MPATRMWCGVLLAVVALGVAGCSSNTRPSDKGVTPMGKTYVSTDVKGSPIPGGGPLTLSFKDNRISANAGCNTATGPVTLDGHVVTTTDNMASTLIACPGDLAYADQWVQGFLSSSPDWKIYGSNLILTGNGQTVTLRDRQVAQPPKPLIGTTWIVDGLIRPDATVRSRALDEARPALTIAADNTLSGSAGCNSITGNAEVNGKDVTFHVATTKMMCDADVMAVEAEVLQALDGKTTTSIDGDTLTIRNTANNTGLELRVE
ncbi:META domain-containing protein [Nocardia sp. NPDC020380]|uniref:META domain-containing protein n=1 Tax=Nocardia sp. NPDC020380 TaxID=3364309 RepID=UPI0037B68B8E